jgi:L-lactate dehydrogenase complex protein LldG
MAQEHSAEDCLEQFVAAAATHGVDVQRLPRVDVTATIETLVEQPAVGTPIPFEGVSLPAAVTTDPTVAELRAARTGVTAAAGAIASYGTLCLSTDEAGSEPVSLFPDLHVAVVDAEDIHPDMAAAFEWLGDRLRETRDSTVLATGPSATADMGELVRGAHGPNAVEVLVVE